MTIVAVADTGPLIHLAEIDALDLLTVIDELPIPETVYAKLEEGGVPPGFSDLEWEGIEVVKPVESSAELDAGERAALAVALVRDDIVFLTDDLVEFSEQLTANRIPVPFNRIYNPGSPEDDPPMVTENNIRLTIRQIDRDISRCCGR